MGFNSAFKGLRWKRVVLHCDEGRQYDAEYSTSTTQPSAYMKNNSRTTPCTTANYTSCDLRQFLKVKVKFTVEQATKAQRGSRDIAIHFL